MGGMRMGSLALIGAGLAAVAVACGGTSAATGVVSGSTPTCYGPGPDDDLMPTLTIDVRQGTALIAKGRFRSSEVSHRYQFSLASGRYEIATSPGGTPIQVRVRAGHTVTADLPRVGCT
jgi:hypothetical protein